MAMYGPVRGPDHEQIQFATAVARKNAAVAFWRVVNGGHGVQHWMSSSMLYWNKVKDMTNE